MVQHQPVNVLYIEDSMAEAEVLIDSLTEFEGAEFDITHVTNLSDGLSRLADERRHFDAVLADLGLPDASGLGAAESIIAKHPNIPLVVLTGRQPIKSGLNAITLGAQDFLTKSMNNGPLIGQSLLMSMERKRLGMEVEKANSRILKLSQFKDELLATVSHDLKNPISNIYSFTEVLLENPNENDVVDPFEVLKIIRQQSEFCLGLIDDLLGAARSKGKIELIKKEVEVVSLIECAVFGNRLAFERKGVSCETEVQDNFLVQIDFSRMLQVLNNLLSNALKFLTRGDRVLVKVKGRLDADSNKQWVDIMISDNGPGISKEKQELIFQKFGQASEADALRGHGLGLYICNSICTLHGGLITVDSALGEGATFTISLPLQ